MKIGERTVDENVIYEGAKVDSDERIYCDRCNGDLSIDGAVDVISHIDMTDCAQTNYKCNYCGNVVSVIVKREMCWSD